MKNIQEPSFAVIESVKEVGIINPCDRPWEQINLPGNNQNFVKYNCECIRKHSLDTDKKDIEIVEVILRPFCYSEHKQKIIYYIGQCIRCETIYWLRD